MANVDNSTEEIKFKLLKILEKNPDMTQRELAKELGISLGSVNYCLKALIHKGFIKLSNFNENPNKLGYLYLLTPMGITEKTFLTAKFLKRKLQEYVVLKQEIAELKVEIEVNSSC